MHLLAFVYCHDIARYPSERSTPQYLFRFDPASDLIQTRQGPCTLVFWECALSLKSQSLACTCLHACRGGMPLADIEKGRTEHPSRLCNRESEIVQAPAWSTPEPMNHVLVNEWIRAHGDIPVRGIYR
jgi:hypothetical protein